MFNSSGAFVKLDESPCENFSIVSQELYKLGGRLEVLKKLAWPEQTKIDFFKSHGQIIPRVEYPRLDLSEEKKFLSSLAGKLGKNSYSSWLRKSINILKQTCEMLESMGTPEFYELSKSIYGVPKIKFKDEKSTSLEMAEKLLSITGKLEPQSETSRKSDYCILADVVAAKMESSVKRFGDSAPKIEVVKQLSANALATANSVKIRSNACFSDRDIGQLIEHEINIHVATILNGREQDKCLVLGTNLPSTTKTQEGLAVFSEIITGNMDLLRLKRLAHRVIAIQMAIDGASFIDVFRYYCNNGVTEDQAFENSRRVFRGGVNSGGSPFTKDVVYLDGLLRVHNFLRAVVRLGKTEYLKLLFLGRLDLEDMHIIKKLNDQGYLKPAKYLPYWVEDMRFLLSYLSYSSLLNDIDMSLVTEHYEEILS